MLKAFRILACSLVALMACQSTDVGHVKLGSTIYGPPILAKMGLAVWQNSLVSGDLSSPQWQPWQNLGSTKPSVQPYSGADLNGGYQGAIVNTGLAANNDLVFAFCSPGTGFTISVDAGTISGAATFNWVLWDETNNTTPDNVSSAVTVTTASPTLSTYTNSYTSLTVGRVYFAGFRFNTGSQGSFMFANPRVVPTGVVSTSLFAGNFQRIDIKPDQLYGNHWLATSNFHNLRVFSPHAPQSEMRLATNANKIAAEIFNPYGVNALAWGHVCWRVNGQPYAFSTVGNNFGSLFEQALPATTTQVDTIVGDNAILANGQPATFPQMPYLGTVFVPAGSLVAMVPRSTGARVVWLGDSMTAGVGSTTSCFDSFAALSKSTWPGEVYVDGEQGRALFNDANTAAELSATTTRLSAVNPTHINILLGYNDWANAQTTSTFSTEVTNLSNSLVAALPNTQIRWILPIISGAEATQNGTTLATLGQLRQVERAAVLALNKPNVMTLDGTEMMPIGQLYIDGIHPGPQGHATLWNNVASAMAVSQGAGYSGSGPFDPTSIAGFAYEWKPEYGFNAGTWVDYSSTALNAAQATGAKQPTMSSTGGPNGTPCVNFASASSQSLAVASTGGLTNNNWTVFVVAKSLATNAQMEWLDLGDTDTGEGFGIGTDLNATGNRNGEHGGVAGEISWGSATTSWEAWTIQRSAGTVSARVNGSAVTVSGATQTINAFNAQTTIGARNNGAAEFLNGSLRRVLAYNAVLSAGNIAIVEAALRAESAIW